MVRLKMSETLREAVTFIEQGHVRVGPNVVREPSFHVTRNMEDFVTWVDTSKIRRKVMAYNDKVDDFELLGAWVVVLSSRVISILIIVKSWCLVTFWCANFSSFCDGRFKSKYVESKLRLFLHFPCIVVRERERDGKGKAQTFSFVLGRAKRQTFLLNRVVVSGKAKINKSGKNISTVVLFVMNTHVLW